MEELAIRSFLRLFLLEHELDRPFEFTVTGSLKPLYTEKDIAAAQKAAEMAPPRAMMLSGSSPRRMPGKRNRPCGATV